MNSINKKLYAVILVCLMLLSFGIVAIAEEGTSSNTGNVSSSTANTESSGGNESAGTGDTTSLPTYTSDVSSTDISSNTVSELVSSYTSNLTDSSYNTNTSESLTSSKSSSSKKQTYSSKKQTTTDNNNDYQKPSGYGNVGGNVDDGIDTSGWGSDDTSELQSAGTTEKTSSKEITNYSNLLWILIWIPILLIIASVAALVYVNRKGFVEGEKENLSKDGKDSSSKKKNVKKRKASHKKRTNIYKPRDQRY